MAKTAEALQAVEGDPENEGGEDGGGGGKKKLIVALVGVLVLAAAAYFFLLAPSPAPEEEEPAAEPTAQPSEGEVVPVVTMTANLDGDELRYARVGFAVVLDVMATESAVEPRFPMLQDRSLDIIGAHTPEDLTTQDGRDALRQELTAAAAEIWPDGEVLRVVLTELIVQ